MSMFVNSADCIEQHYSIHCSQALLLMQTCAAPAGVAGLPLFSPAYSSMAWCWPSSLCYDVLLSNPALLSGGSREVDVGRHPVPVNPGHDDCVGVALLRAGHHPHRLLGVPLQTMYKLIMTSRLSVLRRSQQNYALFFPIIGKRSLLTKSAVSEDL